MRRRTPRIPDIATTLLEALEGPKQVKWGQKGGNIPKRIAALLQ